MTPVLLLSSLCSASAQPLVESAADTLAGCDNNGNPAHSPTYGVGLSRWGHLPQGGWRGAVLGPHGKVYGIPTNATSVLEIDPATRKVSTFGQLGNVLSDSQCAGSTHCGDEKWIGGVYIPTSGKIIGIPYAAETVLEINTAERYTTTFGIVSSTVKRKWVDGVLGRNGLVYAIPYDADVVLEIDPETRALMLFGRVGSDPCKWYGGVLGPNDKIYTIPYSSPYVLEIDTERRIARPFAMTYPHWAKWSGGVLAPNGKIYGIPALSKSVLEIDVEREQTSLYGMLPGGHDLQDKWSGGALAPNGRIYGMPWRSSSVLEFDPITKAISLLGTSTGSGNFSWSGGVLTGSGRIVAVPYNSANVLEIGKTACAKPKTVAVEPWDRREVPMPMKTVNAAPPVEIDGVSLQAQASAANLKADTESRTFVLALLGCPDAAKASEDACFHLSHRQWHSTMVTIMKAESTLNDVRETVAASRLSHVPTDFCFLFNGHPLDPNVEGTIKASSVAIPTTTSDAQPPQPHSTQLVVLIDNVHCNIGPKTTFIRSYLTAPGSIGTSEVILLAAILCAAGGFACLLARARELKRAPSRHASVYYDRVPACEAQAIMAEGEAASAPEGEAPVPCLQARLRPMFKAMRGSPTPATRTMKV